MDWAWSECRMTIDVPASRDTHTPFHTISNYYSRESCVSVTFESNEPINEPKDAHANSEENRKSSDDLCFFSQRFLWFDVGRKSIRSLDIDRGTSDEMKSNNRSYKTDFLSCWVFFSLQNFYYFLMKSFLTSILSLLMPRIRLNLVLLFLLRRRRQRFLWFKL